MVIKPQPGLTNLIFLHSEKGMPILSSIPHETQPGFHFLLHEEVGYLQMRKFRRRC